MNPYGICSFLISLLLLCSYFSKKRFQSPENKIYDMMIISSFFSSLFSIFAYFTTAHHEMFPDYILLLPKIFLIFLIIWGTSFSLYLIYISTKEKELNGWKILKFLFVTISLIASILVLLLPMEYYSDNGNVYTSGSSVNIAYILATLYFAITLIFIIRNAKKLFDKRYVPVFSFVILFILAITIQYLNPELLIITFIISFNTMIMYFTIENPDARMLKEYENAKDILNNTIAEKELFVLKVSQNIKNYLKKIGRICYVNQNETEINELQQGYIDIDKQKNAIENTINNYLDISYQEKSMLNISNINYLTEILINEIMLLFKGKLSISNKDISFNYNISKNLPISLKGDKPRIKQVIMTLLNNALKHTEQGYINMDISSEVKGNNCELIITIENSGKEIDVSDYNELFNKDKIYESGKVDYLKENLASVNYIIKLMGGTVIVNSNKEKTAVTIHLNQEIIEKQSDFHKDLNKKYNKPNIATVINDEKLKEKYENIFQDSKFDVHHLKNVGELMRMIRKHQILDVIILEENLPITDGVETLHKIKDEVGDGIPVFIIKQNKHFNTDSEYLKEGFCGTFNLKEKSSIIYNRVVELINKE
ncbi:MAG: hybrid sensor histidine kinase/response regulator [bacterium]|nr:hybrid sensor histidine kinase/response regulator [bacterium]